jgi:hypothetical protein
MAVSIADQFEILPTIPRRTGRQINRAGHPADNLSQFWQRSMYYPLLDYYITELTARLLENGGRYQARYLIPMNLPRLTPDTVDVIFDTYKTDVRCDIVMFKAKIKRWATLTTAKPSNLKDTLTSQTKSPILRSAPFCWYFTPCLPAQLRRRDHSLFSVALERTRGQQCLTSIAVLHVNIDIDIDLDSHVLIYFRKISSYWLWLRTLNSNNAIYYVFWFLQQEFITFIILNYFVLPNLYYKYTK